MKQFFKNKLVVGVVAAVLTLGAIGTTWALLAKPKTQNNALTVYTSFYPLYDFAKKVGGNKVEVVNLVQPGEEAHHYEPSTKQMTELYQADLIIINGVGMEGWLQDLDAALTNKIVDTSLGVTLIARNESEEEHEEEGHEHQEEEEEHDHGIYDPHIWLSITNAKKQMENIKNALVAKDSANASYYQNNYETYALLFDGLKLQYDAALNNLEGTPFVVSHRAFGYIANEYGLEQLSLNGIETEGEPDAQTLANMITYINTNHISVVFYQTFVNAKVAQRIAAETSATVGMLSTAEGLTADEIDAGMDYLSIMARNLVALKEAFSA